MRKIEKGNLAEQDLIGIWLYTCAEWGEAQADKYLDALETALALIAETPFICRERVEFLPPVRIYHHEHHLIVYCVSANSITVVRVLYESMDIDEQLE